ncbi:MAG: FkbM family methyltransferase [Hydrotalea sp.]|nr:FkbM family methyltransferase [Hydrotalea sp.]
MNYFKHCYRAARQYIKKILLRYLPWAWAMLRFVKQKIKSLILTDADANKIIKKLIKKYNLNIKSMVQVGGHLGQEIPIFINQGVQAIAVFEPLQSSLKLLRKQFGKNKKITIYPVALGNDTKKIAMNVADNHAASSSLLQPKEHLDYAKHVRFDKTEMVQMKKMDDALDKKNDYNFLMMDVQGYELEVLKGATKTLKKIDYVYSEINQVELYKGCALVGDIDKFLAQYDMVRVYTKWIKEYKNSFGDGLYIRKSLLKKSRPLLYFYLLLTGRIKKTNLS